MNVLSAMLNTGKPDLFTASGKSKLLIQPDRSREKSLFLFLGSHFNEEMLSGSDCHSSVFTAAATEACISFLLCHD